MPEAALSRTEFKKRLRDGSPKMGVFLNVHGPTVAEQTRQRRYLDESWKRISGAFPADSTVDLVPAFRGQECPRHTYVAT